LGKGTGLGCSQTSLDQFSCHVISDESAKKLDETFKHEFKGLGSSGVAARHDGFRNAVDVRL
jgi:protein-L-isoaspartate O-methyltransferase